MAKWLKRQGLENYEKIEDLHEILLKILSLRHISGSDAKKFIFPKYEEDYHDPFLFQDMEKAIARIEQAKKQKEKAVIYGDYDADGITSSVILKETFFDLGLDVRVYIPDKKSEGYGINRESIEKFSKEGVNLIVSVDCGITAVEEVALANSFGIDVIITDHHHVPAVVPDAFAIINPKAEGGTYPFLELAGVGVAFKLAQAVYMKLMPDKLEMTKWMLDLVAIGTVADCVPLVGENRLFVRYGLIVLSKTRRVGLREMFHVGRMNIDANNAADTRKVSFHIAPRINAAGRIRHANLAYDLLSSTNAIAARDLALELEDNNSQRQKITDQVVNEIRIIAERAYKDKKFIFAVNENYPIGVVGLAAGKIAGQFNKPTAVFQKNETVSQGSFRSIPGLNIIEILSECGDVLEKFGGHSQAAGASVKNENLEKFYEKINASIEKKLAGLDLEEEIIYDAEIDPSVIDFDAVKSLKLMRPFGEGNPEPVFLIKNMAVKAYRIVGNGSKHAKMLLAPKGNSPQLFDSISFNGAEKFANVMSLEKIDILCHIQMDEWNGNKKIQFEVIDFK